MNEKKYDQEDISNWIKLALIAKYESENYCDVCKNTGRKKDFTLCECVYDYPFIDDFL